MTVLYPAALGSPLPSRPGIGLTLLIGAEGFASSPAFEEAVADLWDRLVVIPGLESLAEPSGACCVYTYYAGDGKNPFGVTSIAGGLLEADPDLVLSVLGGLELAEPEGAAPLAVLTDLPWPNEGATPYASSVLVILVAAGHLTGRGEWLGTERLDVPYYVAVSAGPDDAVPVAIALGRMAGLADETGTSADVPAFARRRSGLNAVAQAYLDAVSDAEAPDPWLPWRGAPSFKPKSLTVDGVKDAYQRSAGPTLMAVPRTGDIDAEALARGYGPTGRLAVSPASASVGPIGRQELVYDQAAFDNPQKIDFGMGNAVQTPGIERWTYQVDIGPQGPVFSGVQFIAFMPDGMSTYTQPVLERLEFLGLGVVLAGSDTVLPLDLSTPVSSSAVQATYNQPEGDPVPVPGKYQEGVCYTAVVKCSQGTPETSVLVEVRLACAFRGTAADFDPPQAIEAAPIFPQISFKQVAQVAEYGLDPGGFLGTVAQFRGTVRLVGDVYTPGEMRDHMLTDEFQLSGPDQASTGQQESVPDPETDPVNYLALFTDMSNLLLNQAIPELELLLQDADAALQQFLLTAESALLGDWVNWAVTTRDTAAWMLRLGLGAWVAFFDYVERIDPPRQPSPGTPAGAATPKQFLAVAATGEDPPEHTDSYFAKLPWAAIPGGALTRKLRKEPRQAAYDNMHLHGTMGTVGNLSATDPKATPRLMAPGCGHSCFHAHWRWGNTTYYLAVSRLAQPQLGVIQELVSVVIADSVSAYLTSNGLSEDESAQACAQWLWSLAGSAGFPAPPPTDKFKGWSSAGPFSAPHQHPGAPLIPPNQRLEVAVGGQSDVGTPLPPEETMDRHIKTIDLITTVSCDATYDPGWVHCTTEFPVGVAVRYTESPALLLFRLTCFAYWLDPGYLPQNALSALASALGPDAAPVAEVLKAVHSYPATKVFNDAYDIIPFLNERDSGFSSGFDAEKLIHATNAGRDLEASHPSRGKLEDI
jgi:hypothetical protein